MLNRTTLFRIWGILVACIACFVFCPLSYGQEEAAPEDGHTFSDALPFYNLGNRYMQRQWYEKAVENYTEAISRWPNDADFFINLGVAYRKLDRYKDAESSFMEAARLKPKEWMTWNNLGNVYMKENQLKQSVSAFERALTCNPPLEEREAIQQDIVSIKKIIAMGLDLPATEKANASNSTVPPFKAPSVNASKKGTTPRQQAKQPVHKFVAQKPKLDTTGSTTSSTHSHPVVQKKPAGAEEASKKSGWDLLN